MRNIVANRETDSLNSITVFKVLVSFNRHANRHFHKGTRGSDLLALQTHD